ncbi:MAG: Fic family protein [Bifidobacteriaceae bacterium]|jgi:Fic family protein|nr:Fic family protein [Bifidobacteriaceae bacterium]
MSYQPFPDFTEWAVQFDPALVEAYRQRFERARESAEHPRLDAAAREVLRSAAVETGAIEGLYPSDRGFTRSVATMAAGWEAAADQKGPHVRTTIEDQLRAYELVLDAATGSDAPAITQAWLRELHAALTASQETCRVQVDLLDGARRGWQDRKLEHGAYKTWPNSPSWPGSGEVRAYAPPGDTPAEMARLVDQLRTSAFEQAHPVVRAAYAHHALTWIHPFADGNGRVARALASVFLYQLDKRFGVPFLMFADQRNEYYDALEAADRGLREPLVDFFAERVIDAILLIEQALGSPEGPADPLVASIRDKLAWHTAIDRINLAAGRLASACEQALRGALRQLDLPNELRLEFKPLVSGRRNLPESPDSLRAALPPHLPVRSIEVTIKVGNAKATMLVAVSGLWSPELAGSGIGPQLSVAIDNDKGVNFIVRLHELEPVLTQSLSRRLALWASRAARLLLDRVNEAL